MKEFTDNQLPRLEDAFEPSSGKEEDVESEEEVDIKMNSQLRVTMLRLKIFEKN